MGRQDADLSRETCRRAIATLFEFRMKAVERGVGSVHRFQNLETSAATIAAVTRPEVQIRLLHCIRGTPRVRVNAWNQPLPNSTEERQVSQVGCRRVAGSSSRPAEYRY